VERYCRAGNYSKAANLATSSPLLPGTPLVLALLQEKHIPRTQQISAEVLHYIPPPPTPQPTPNDHAGDNEDPSRLFQLLLRTSPKRSGSGPDGWRFEHLKLLLSDPAALAAVSAVNDLIGAGCVPQQTSLLLAMARLIPLLKRGTVDAPEDVRPIAIGSALRRLAEKTLLRTHSEELQAHFLPHQLAVAVPNGTELGTKAVQVLLHARPTWGVLELDISNAYNTVSRAAFLDAALAVFPALLPCLRMFYSPATSLVVQDDTSPTGFSSISSDEGVHQGAPLSTLAHALAIHTALQTARPLVASGATLAFSDDIKLQ
jgi:hypothetical protein